MNLITGQKIRKQWTQKKLWKILKSNNYTKNQAFFIFLNYFERFLLKKKLFADSIFLNEYCKHS
jgi:hypothetical protein